MLREHWVILSRWRLKTSMGYKGLRVNEARKSCSRRILTPMNIQTFSFSMAFDVVLALTKPIMRHVCVIFLKRKSSFQNFDGDKTIVLMCFENNILASDHLKTVEKCVSVFSISRKRSHKLYIIFFYFSWNDETSISWSQWQRHVHLIWRQKPFRTSKTTKCNRSLKTTKQACQTLSFLNPL